MRAVLNRHIPLDAIIRWWYVLAAGPLLGLMFSLATNFKPFHPINVKMVPVTVGTDVFHFVLFMEPGWKDYLLFGVIGFLLACGVTWLLEEMHEPHLKKG